jgi:hypothetical protein
MTVHWALLGLMALGENVAHEIYDNDQHPLDERTRTIERFMEHLQRVRLSLRLTVFEILRRGGYVKLSSEKGMGGI